MKDYYKIMGVADTATDKEIKVAYRRLARKYHPDISKEVNAEEHFKEVGEAYEVLKDPVKRKKYDQFRALGSEGPTFTPPPTQEEPFFDIGGDFFESLFGKRAYQHSRGVAGANYESTIHISLEDAYHGAVKELHLPVDKKDQILRVKIPAGIKSGQQIRLAGQGGSSPNGSGRGDLYLTVQINKHPLFDVKGNDIYLTLPIAPWEAALGAKVQVPTLAGQVELKIPPGTQGGQMLRLKHRGLQGKEAGSQYVILKIVTPLPKTEEERQLYRRMAESMHFNPRESLRSS